MEFLAHISDDGRKQTVQEHLEGTARLCSEFAAEFDAAEQGYLAGISHDIGKYTEAFQRRLHGGTKVDHATAGAIECANAGSGQAAVCVIGHHNGLPDLGNIRADQPGDATFYGRIKKGLMVRHFGATAVLCTATQPVLGDIFKQFGWSENIPELCPGTQTLYEIFRRVSFRNAGELSNEMLAGELKNNRQVLCIVNSRRAAQEIYSMLPEEGAYHLSTLMYPAHRQRVLNEIRQRLKEGAVCRVLSTSLIEAGVDVDFPTVYREMAGLDSVLQAAGRCNREGRRSSAESIIAIFESEYTSPLLIKDNIGAANEALAGGADPGLPETITKYFSLLRDIIGDGTDKADVVKKLERGISGCMMPFDSVAQGFHMIDNNTKTVYIPLEEGAAIAEKLKSGFATREVYRKAGRYGVNAYDIQYRRLLDAGNIEPLDENSAVLVNMELYNENTGLSLDCEQETGFLYK